MAPHVLIAGAGIGGLALAQGLRRAGVPFQIFERDPALDARAQGYRFRIDADGTAGLRACLPDHLFALYQATASIPAGPPAGVFDQNLQMVYRFGASTPAAPAPPSHVAANRLTLRQVLLAELGDALQFGKAAVSAEQSASEVRLNFSDGTSAKGNVLVAADGVHSPLRAQSLPHAEIIDVGMSCIYGRAPLTPEMLEWLPSPLLNGFTPVLGAQRRTLALGPFRKGQPFAEAVARLAPGVEIFDVADYMMWILVVPDADLAADAKSAQPIEPESPAQLHARAMTLLSNWHPDLQRIVAGADVGATFRIPIRSSRRIDPWPASRITFLGDAVHVMTPAGGIGANTALRDAALLSQQLGECARGTLSLLDSVANYETSMREYAFAAVDRSLESASHLYQFAATRPERR